MWLVLVGVCAAAALWFLRRPLARWRSLLEVSGKLSGPAFPRLSLGEDALSVFTAAYRRHGTPCRIWVGPRLYVLVSHPDDARAVLGGTAFHERDRSLSDVLRPFTGGGLITATTRGWHLRRRLVGQVLTAPWVQSQRGWLSRAAERLVEALRQVIKAVPAAEQQEAVVRELSACSLDAVAGSVLGQQARATGRPPAGFVHHYLLAAQLLHHRVRHPWLLPSPLLGLTSTGQTQARLVRQVHGYIDAAIDNMAHSSTRDQESHIALSWERAAENGDDPDRLAGSALELLMGLTEDRRLVREELVSLLLTGQLTTAAALGFTLQLLALHQQVQTAAVHDEALRRRTVLESLRLFPPSALVTRELAEDVPLPGGQCVLPAGCTAVVCPLLTHREPAVWSDPNAFKPDRFLEEESQKRHPYAFLSFGGGQRSCPGSEYTLQQLCAVLSKLLPAFRVVTTGTREDLEDLRMGMVLAPRKGFQLQLVPRV